MKWMGEKPEKCDICGIPLGKNDFIDGATHMGPWAIMDTGCHHVHGRGLGTGKGQMYDGITLEKIEG